MGDSERSIASAAGSIVEMGKVERMVLLAPVRGAGTAWSGVTKLEIAGETWVFSGVPSAPDELSGTAMAGDAVLC